MDNDRLVERSAAAPGPRSEGPAVAAAVAGARVTGALPYGAAVQARGGQLSGDVQRAAAAGVSGSAGSLPYLDRIQGAFGRHDVGGVRSYVGGAAAGAARSMGTTAYATGDRVAFAGQPDLHTAAHEAAHVVQQRAGVQLYGGVGRAGDAYERHADAVADRVVAGGSAEGLLDQMAGGGGGGGAGGGAVQTYTRVPVSLQSSGYFNLGQDLRVSDDGKMAVVDHSHSFYATDDVIAQTQQTMAAQHSPFLFATGRESLRGRVPGSKEGKSPDITLWNVVPTNTGNATSGGAMKTVEACSSHGQELMGAGGGSGTHPMDVGMAVVTGGTAQTPTETEHRYDKRGAEGTGLMDTNVMGDVRAQVTGGPRDKAPEAYGKLSTKKKDQKAQELGINQYADPEVGEALAVYRASGKVGPDEFPMHFAGVVAKSGGDYVTLENYAKNTTSPQGSPLRRKPNDTPMASNDWYVKMYGPAKKGDDQSFYGENVEEGDYGGKKGTMVLKHRAVQGYPIPPELQAANAVYSRVYLFARQPLTRQYPTFFAKWPTFTAARRAVELEALNAWIENRPLQPAKLTTLTQKTTEIQTVQVVQDLVAGVAPTPEVPVPPPTTALTPPTDDDTTTQDVI